MSDRTSPTHPDLKPDQRPPMLYHLASEVHGARRWQIGEIVYEADDRRPAGGPMAPYLGRMLEPREVLATENFEYSDDSAAASLARGWLVPSLHGATFGSTDLAGVGSALVTVLADRLPVTPWALDPHFALVLGKYGCIHASALAPRDDTTGQPMELELFAEQRRPCRSVADWVRSTDRHTGVSTAGGPFEFEIEVVTYSNMHALGVGMPSYS